MRSLTVFILMAKYLPSMHQAEEITHFKSSIDSSKHPLDYFIFCESNTPLAGLNQPNVYFEGHTHSEYVPINCVWKSNTCILCTGEIKKGQKLYKVETDTKYISFA